jgi:hypothetical protein
MRTRFSQEQIDNKREAIREKMMNGFPSFSLKDDRIITRAIRGYDEHFLGGLLKKNSLKFEVEFSSKLTSAGAKIMLRGFARFEGNTVEDRIAIVKNSKRAFLIKVSSHHLASVEIGRPQKLNGITTDDRCTAVQLLVEHELCHFIETILTGSTGHGAAFQSLASSMFGHSGYHHEMGADEVTDENRSKEKFVTYCSKFGLSPEYHGQTYVAGANHIKIVSIDPKRKKYPVIGIDQNGRRWKLTAFQIKCQLG